MAEHDCIQGEVIAALKNQQKADVASLRRSMDEMVTEIRVMCTDIRAALVEDRAQKVEIQHLKADMSLLQQNLATISTTTRNQQSWIDKADGTMKAFLAIPTLCAVASAGTAIWMAVN